MNTKLIQQLLNVSIWIIILTGLNGTIPLVRSEFVEGNICPRIIGIPACYIILSCLLFMCISQVKVFQDRNKLYFLGVMIALLIATIGSLGNLLGYIECPKTDQGTPMCYLSFLLFFSLLILKVIYLKRMRTIRNS